MKLEVTLLRLHFCSSYKFLPTLYLSSSGKRKSFELLKKNFRGISSSQCKFQVLENDSLSDAPEKSKNFKTVQGRKLDIETVVLQILLH